MMHYAVTPDGTVRSYRQKGIALAMVRQLGEGAAYACVNGETEDLSKLPTPVLVTLHNLVRPERPVTRFTDRATAEKRLKGVLEVLAKPGEAPTEIAGEIEQTEIPGTEVTESTEGTEAAGDESAESTEPEPEFVPDPTKSQEENDQMAAAAKNARKSAAKKGAAKKGAAKRAPRAETAIPESTVRKVIKLRADGMGWPEVLKTVGEKSNSFIHRVRPLMKKLDKSSVLAIGPGSPNYGKKKGVAKKAAKKSGK